ncbi:response regulator [Vibrio sp. WJH972]
MSGKQFSAREELDIKSKLQGKSILLVDDDPIFRSVMRSCLESYGCLVDEVENGLEGLVRLDQHSVDLVMCDLSMPILTGIEFVEEVSHSRTDLPIIVVSGTDAMSDVAQALKYGIKEFIAKPVRDYAHVMSMVSNILEDAKKQSVERDLASAWDRQESEDVPEEKELHFHLDYLQNNPPAARDLLHALMPDNDNIHGDWRFSYRLLQTADVMPLVFDCAWLSEGQFVFYIVDSGSHATEGVSISLLVRALFHDYIRTLKTGFADLKDLAQLIEHGIRCSSEEGAVSAMLGVVDTVSGSMSILPAGLNGQWRNENNELNVLGGVNLGDNCMRNFVTKDLPIGQKSKVLVHNTGVCSFTLDIMKQITT